MTEAPIWLILSLNTDSMTWKESYVELILKSLNILATLKSLNTTNPGGCKSQYILYKEKDYAEYIQEFEKVPKE